MGPGGEVRKPAKVFYQAMVSKQEKQFYKFLKVVLKIMWTYRYKKNMLISTCDYLWKRLFNAIMALGFRLICGIANTVLLSEIYILEWFKINYNNEQDFVVHNILFISMT